MRLGSAGLTQGRGRLKVLHMSLTSLLGVSGLCASLATAAVSRGQPKRLPWHLSSGTQPLCHSGQALPTATWSWLPCEDSGRGFGCELQFPRACEHWSGEHSQCLNTRFRSYLAGHPWTSGWGGGPFQVSQATPLP